ncbi:divalent metal cation transporter [Bradyrhizobium sp. WSM 1704]|uniref:NRAMP family divalent metal transporter n=1 Tax=Bradyrhizobium semiaridum TaxID=2821404 RepID=UPI001CE2F3F4|nr:divalent metal cation transporter [Bradyrhizobium semiaridum]MCA6125178.1 divalent metal cation transporter [Bradyrhizobium semiaridum]
MADKDEAKAREPGLAKAIGLGIITGAADDDPSAIGTYASAGAQFGTQILWMAPVALPMMFTVVYLSSKLGQVSGRGLFQVIRDFYPRWLLWAVLVGVMIGNTIEAAADLGGMAAALGIFIPLPIPLIVGVVATGLLALQVLGSYATIRSVFRWLALALLAYVAAALLARPSPGLVLIGTLVPSVRFDRDFLAIVVAIIGTSLSAYIYTWESNQQVEEKIEEGKTRLSQRIGASKAELARSRRDVLIGMTFSNAVMYFIIMSTGATLHAQGQTNIETAAQAAEALRPLAGAGASVLFTVGIIGVGFLAVPVMTAGAAYDLAQAFGWRASLHARPGEAPRFYWAIAGLTAIAVMLNFLGFNPMRTLVWSGIVQGLSTPPLLLLIMLMTNSRKIMGDKVNTPWMNVLGWITTGAVFSASLGLVATWLL